MNYSDSVILVICSLGLSFLLLQNLRAKSVISRAKKGILPSFIESFYIPFIDRSGNATEKIIDFLGKAASKEKKISLELDESDLNELLSIGDPELIFNPGDYVFYSLHDGYIIKHSLKWPVINSLDLCESNSTKILFKEYLGCIYEEDYLFEVNSRIINNYPKATYEICCAPVISCILRHSDIDISSLLCDKALLVENIICDIKDIVVTKSVIRITVVSQE